MRVLVRTVLLMVVAGLAGCVVLSANGLYEDDKDLVFDPALIGAWQSDKPMNRNWDPDYKSQKRETWEFQKLDDRSAYKLLYTDEDGHHGVFEVGMVKIEGKQYLDLAPGSETLSTDVAAKMGDIPAFYLWHIHVQALHSFIRVDQIGSTLVFAMPDLEKWRNWVAAHPDAVAHEGKLANEQNHPEAGLLLKATTPELRKFVGGPMNKPDFWHSISMTRKQISMTAPSKSH